MSRKEADTPMFVCAYSMLSGRRTLMFSSNNIGYNVLVYIIFLHWGIFMHGTFWILMV